MNTAIKTHMPLTEVSTTAQILQSALKALGEGRIGEVIDTFDDDFTFNDQAVELQFIDKERLSEFFLKGRELFPDTAVEILLHSNATHTSLLNGRSLGRKHCHTARSNLDFEFRTRVCRSCALK